jgi:acetyl-CoA C-acetyltransferase
MRDVYIVERQTDIGELWNRSLMSLAVEAVRKTLAQAGGREPDCLVVGNMLSGELASQENLGAFVADWAGLGQVEAVKVEAACGSGGAALREGYLRVAAGVCDCVLVVAVEKMTDQLPDAVSAGLAPRCGRRLQTLHGTTFVASTPSSCGGTCTRTGAGTRTSRVSPSTLTATPWPTSMRCFGGR